MGSTSPSPRMSASLCGSMLLPPRLCESNTTKWPSLKKSGSIGVAFDWLVIIQTPIVGSYESDPTSWPGFQRCREFADCAHDACDRLIMPRDTMLQFVELSRKLGIRCDHFSQTHESPHDRDVRRDRASAAEHR